MVSQRLRVDFWSRVCLRDGSREEEGEEESYSLIKGLKRQTTRPLPQISPSCHLYGHRLGNYP
jgi:hypothetical protein